MQTPLHHNLVRIRMRTHALVSQSLCAQLHFMVGVAQRGLCVYIERDRERESGLHVSAGNALDNLSGPQRNQFLEEILDKKRH